MQTQTQHYLMLIKVTERTMRESTQLVSWIKDIDREYMEKWRDISMSAAHLAFEDGPWNFALVFTGNKDSVTSLTRAINERAPGQTEILTLEGIDLDDFTANGGKFAPQ